MPVKITFLGTGTSQGVPVIACDCATCQSADPRDNRLRTSVMVEHLGMTAVIDTGPDFREQMLRSRAKRLDAVVFTHCHKDHTAGLDDIRPFFFMQGEKIKVYATEATTRQLKMEFAYMFATHKYPGVADIEVHEIGSAVFRAAGMDFLPIHVLHHKMPVLGFRIGDFVYITDANHIGEAEKEKAKGAGVLVLNALRKESHISHFTLAEALSLIAELKPKQAYLTHISHQLGRHADVEQELPQGVSLAYDGLEIRV